MKTAEHILDEKGTDIIAVDHTTRIFDALKLMLQKKVGAVVVERDGDPVGIWTARDLMRNSTEKDFDPHTACVADYMSAGILSAPYSDTAYSLMDKFLGRRVNHLLIEKEGQYIGLLSSGDVMRATLQEKTEELSRLNRMVSWEYYEEWRWKP
jgi:signal-transduction protein with cAMP-binding, CBS, and nucleotidyltransferase domain